MPHRLTALVALAFAFAATFAAADAPAPFEIQVLDEATGRGVPLVELRTPDAQRFYTDSAGRVAITDPSLMHERAWFHVESHGYTHPRDGFGNAGRALSVEPGGRATIEIQRENIAQRLYRITGRDLYHHTVRLGHDAPIQRPLLNQQVVGQDSTQALVHDGRIRWFWGDTHRLDYPLGNFRMTAATSPLPEDGGLHPDEGVNLEYLDDGQGFVRPMTPLPNDDGNLMWLDRFVTVPDDDGRQRLVARYAHLAGLGEVLSHGLVIYDDGRQEFDLLKTEMNLDEPFPTTRGHATATRFEDTETGDAYWFFARPFPAIRVADSLAAIQNEAAYEAFTPLAPGASFDGEDTAIERDDDGRVVWGWKPDTDPVSQEQERQLIEASLIDADDARFQLRDVDTGEEVVMHGASVRFNEHRDKWIMIGNQVHGSSYLGEVWFAEADAPTGPWRYARKIATHENYSFYNPSHHAFFDQDAGRYIYFEGTYTDQFSAADFPTPLYDYNQIMYRLDLEDDRLDLPLQR